jgi:hypothetical protein
LIERGLAVRSVALLAPAIRLDEFERDMLSALREQQTTLSLFLLNEQRELDDSCTVRDVTIYQKSLLYLVSRALERGAGGKPSRVEVPLLGMAKFLDERLASGRTVRAELGQLGGVIAVAPTDAPSDRRTSSQTHGGFDDDGPTMTSVLARILESQRIRQGMQYRPNAALQTAAGPTPSPAGEPSKQAHEHGGQEAALPAAVQPPGETPLVELAEAQTAKPRPPRQEAEPVLEVGDAPETGATVIDLLRAQGWTVAPSQELIVTLDAHPARATQGPGGASS